MSEETVLVTGGSGFIASYCILGLLDAGYRVRTTLRSLSREGEVRAQLAAGGANPGDRLSFVEANLLEDSGWAEAVADCAFALHVASPFPPAAPTHEDELIVPARDGALRLLRAAKKAGVKRVVLTSSFAAIGYGHAPRDRPFDEGDWTDLHGGPMSAYVKSKTIAERAAWDFVAGEGRGLELSVINPVGVLGPVLGTDYSFSIQLLERLIAGALPGLPRLSMGIVDVRDVADLHIRAMTHPAAKGERFIAISGDAMSIREIAALLRTHFGTRASKVPTRPLPDWIIRLAALFDSSIAQTTYELGKVKAIAQGKAQRLLGWSPRSREEAIVACVESLAQHGILK